MANTIFLFWDFENVYPIKAAEPIYDQDVQYTLWPLDGAMALLSEW